MNTFDPAQTVQSVFDFWMSLIPQFMGQFEAPSGARSQGPPMMPWMNAMQFPADELARAAQMTQQSLQAMAQAMAPMMQAAGMPGIFGRSTDAPAVEPAGRVSGGFGKTRLPTHAEMHTAFDRTYGALADALGLGPARRLQAAWQDLVGAAAKQEEARASYAMLINSAFTAGYERLLARLADTAAGGARVESVLALIKLWAVCTEDAVHETLQSEQGLAATAALTRASLAYHAATRKVADEAAEMLGLATRRDVDEAFREVQVLKRELRKLRMRGATT